MDMIKNIRRKGTRARIVALAVSLTVAVCALFTASARVAPVAAAGADEIDIPIQIQWDDEDNKYGNRPSSLVVHAYDESDLSIIEMGDERSVSYLDSEPVGSITVEADNDWSGSFEGLPKYDDAGDEITYWLATAWPDGYAYPKAIRYSGEDALPIDVKASKIGVSVYKVWDDAGHEDLRPSSIDVIVSPKRIVNHEIVGDGVDFRFTMTEDDATDDYTWYKSLPVPNMINGEYVSVAYEGSVSEDTVAGYAGSVQTNIAKGDLNRAVITNTYNASEPSNEPSDTPSEPEDTTPGQDDPRDITPSDPSPAVPVPDTPPTVLPFGVQIPVHKVWDDEGDKYGVRPDTLQLFVFDDPSVEHMLYGGTYNDGMEEIYPELLDALVGTYEMTGTGNEWDYTINLPKYNDDNEEIQYYVAERAGGYYCSSSSNNLWDGENPVSFTNKPVLVSPSIVKVWDDNHDAEGHRPDEITFQLYNGDELVAESRVKGQDASVVVGENMWLPGAPDEHGAWSFYQDASIDAWVWTSVFPQFPAYDKAGNEIPYEVREVVPTGYKMTRNQRLTKPIRHYIWNEWEGYPTTTTVAAVAKAWQDEGHEDERPVSLIAHLYANDVDTGRVVELTPSQIMDKSVEQDLVTGEHNGDVWHGYIDGLPTVGDDGQPITYRFVEDDVDGYTLVDTVPSSAGLTILYNAYDEEEPLPAAGLDPNDTAIYAGIAVAAASFAAILAGIGRRENRRKDRNMNIRTRNGVIAFAATLTLLLAAQSAPHVALAATSHDTSNGTAEMTRDPNHAVDFVSIVAESGDMDVLMTLTYSGEDPMGVYGEDYMLVRLDDDKMGTGYEWVSPDIEQDEGVWRLSYRYSLSAGQRAAFWILENLGEVPMDLEVSDAEGGKVYASIVGEFKSSMVVSRPVFSMEDARVVGDEEDKAGLPNAKIVLSVLREEEPLPTPTPEEPTPEPTPEQPAPVVPTPVRQVVDLIQTGVGDFGSMMMVIAASAAGIAAVRSRRK